MHWLTWKEVREISKKKTLIFFGRSEEWVRKSLKVVKPKYIVDSQELFWGSKYENVEIVSINSKKIKSIKNPFFVITTGSYESVIEILNKKKLKPGIDYACCPEYKDFAELNFLRNYKKKIIFTSPDYQQKRGTRFSKAGGGIFITEIGLSHDKFSYEKKIDGQFRQIIKYKGNYLCVEHDHGKILIIDKKFKILDTIPLSSPNCCGIEFCNVNNLIYVANTHTDQIFVLNDEFRLINKINFGKLSGDKRESRYHINDLTCKNGNLYVSYFSKKGIWKDGKFDGGVSLYSLNSNKFKTVIKGLYMPHTPKFLKNDLFVCDSSRGRLIKNGKNISEFAGFLRGLDHDERYIFLGLSETMYFSRLLKLNKLLNLNASIVVFDIKKKISRVYNLLDIGNIHEIILSY